VEGRGRPEGNLLEKAKIRTQSRVALLLNLRWVNGAARSMNRAVLGYLREEPYAGKPHVRFCEGEVELILQRAREQFPQASPRIISDNGPQFIRQLTDFKEFIRICGMTHVRTSPFYPQSNGKIERWHQSLKAECVRPGVPLSIQDARRLLGRYVDHYNRVRLHSAIGDVTPLDKLEGREVEIFAQRDCKLQEARRQRQLRRQSAISAPPMLPVTVTGEAPAAGLN
jgi:transposase InsO family protein